MAAAVTLGGGALVLAPAATAAAPVETAAAADGEPSWWPPVLSEDGTVDTRGGIHPQSYGNKCWGYTVPPGVSNVRIRVWGSPGHTGATRGGHGGGAGGWPSEVNVTAAVEPGERLYPVTTQGGPSSSELLQPIEEFWSRVGWGGDGSGITTTVGPDCGLADHSGLLAFAGGGGGGGDGDSNGPGRGPRPPVVPVAPEGASGASGASATPTGRRAAPGSSPVSRWTS